MNWDGRSKNRYIDPETKLEVRKVPDPDNTFDPEEDHSWAPTRAFRRLLQAPISPNGEEYEPLADADRPKRIASGPIDFEHKTKKARIPIAAHPKDAAHTGTHDVSSNKEQKKGSWSRVYEEEQEQEA